MGKAADKSAIAIKMLNSSKGPAVQSLRAQIDRKKYQEYMKQVLEETENIYLKQGEIVDILLDKEGKKVESVITSLGAKYNVKACILATGTYLKGRIYVGDNIIDSGPDGVAASNKLSEIVRNLGINTIRFKTGTPARVNKRSIDFSVMEIQENDEDIEPFSFETEKPVENKVNCYLTYTNAETHKLIQENLDLSPMFRGEIEGKGPRYCPSIEDKVNRFAEKERHQLFIEPEGLDTEEMYIQGMSSSLPEDVQRDFYQSIEGLENIVITRPAYAIEYDCIDPLELKLNLESRIIEKLFCAGQFNGSSGYEEAAAQGLMAGVNAHLAINGKNPFILARNEAYIGVLIDDLITKGTNEPYRIMTSRAEYRLLLRQDNADDRLTEKSYEIGLASEERFNRLKSKQEEVAREIERLSSVTPAVAETNTYLEKINSSPVEGKISLADLLKRPEVTYENLLEIDKERPEMSEHARAQVSVEIKYRGYIKKQIQQVEKFKKLERKPLSSDIDYEQIDGLRIEAAQKLNKIKPVSLGQASRISGVSPADINVLQVHLEKEKRIEKAKS